MKSENVQPENIDEYLKGFPENVQAILAQVRKTIRKAAPEATEAISYGMPAFKLHSAPLAYFAAFKNHIGLYPAPVGIEAFKNDLSAYKTGKGSVQFPIDKPLPLNLITKIVKFRVKQSSEKMMMKEKK